MLELLLLLPFSCVGFFGRGFSNLPLFDPLGALASLAILSLFVCDLNKGCVYRCRSKERGVTITVVDVPSTWAVSRARRSSVFSLKPISTEERIVDVIGASLG